MKKFLKKLVLLNQLHKIIRLNHNLKTKIIPEELLLKSNDKCLLLSPHADDETIGCGGLLLKYPSNFNVICLTDGRYYKKSDNINELIITRKSEFTSVMQKVNIKNYSFLDIEDKHLIDNYCVFSKIDISSFDYIFIPNFLDQHRDHKAVTYLLKKLLKKSNYSKNLKIGFYEVWSTLSIPNFYVDISDLAQNKAELISIYKSQEDIISYSDKILGLNAFRGLTVSRQYVECYTILSLNEFLSLETL